MSGASFTASAKLRGCTGAGRHDKRVSNCNRDRSGAEWDFRQKSDRLIARTATDPLDRSVAAECHHGDWATDELLCFGILGVDLSFECARNCHFCWKLIEPPFNHAVGRRVSFHS